jgi:hypothetical protein
MEIKLFPPTFFVCKTRRSRSSSSSSSSSSLGKNGKYLRHETLWKHTVINHYLLIIAAFSFLYSDS